MTPVDSGARRFYCIAASMNEFDESTLRLITKSVRPLRELASRRDVDSLALPFDVVALGLFLGDLDLNVEELKFVLDLSDEAEFVVESAIRSRIGDVVIDGDSHSVGPCFEFYK